MVLHILRALFVLLMAAVGWFFLTDPRLSFGPYTWLGLTISLCLAVLFVCIDILSPRRKLAVFSGTFLGLLVGVFVAYAFSFVLTLIVDNVINAINSMNPTQLNPIRPDWRDNFLRFANLVLGMICCYLAISFILQTKDDFRFVIPYVEFSKQTKGARSILLDTSVLIDGRIADVIETGIIESQLVVPQFVIDELQLISDSSDKLKRNRGRRGLDMLQKLRQSARADVVLFDSSARDPKEIREVDQKLVHLAQELGARVLTNDFNLNKVAQLRGVDVINLNELAGSLKPVVLPGERMSVVIMKPGDEPGQGVGYLADGTMVVVEQGRSHVNQEVEFTVTSALQTKQGRMIFGRIGDGALAQSPGAAPASAGQRRAPGRPNAKSDPSPT